MKRIARIWRGLGILARTVFVCIAAILLLTGIAVLALGSLSTQEESGPTRPFTLVPAEPAPTPVPLPEFTFPDVDDSLFFDDRPVSTLTGMHANEEELVRRPIAVVINNQFGAHPHSGIAYADIIYQVLVEGTTTRLVAIFQSVIPEKIGPVRSARDYFVDFAFNHDALLVHHGASGTGHQRIGNLLGSNAIDGIRFEGSVFWRDRSFPEWTGNTQARSLEHSSYVGWETLLAHIEARNLRGYFNGIGDNSGYGFAFGALPAGIESIKENVAQVAVPFSRHSQTFFNLCEDTGHFYVEHLHGPWQDDSMRQVSVANVLVQHAAIRIVDGEGRRSVDTVGSGTGYLVRSGQVFSVRWEKLSHTSPMRWFFEDGRPLVLAPGRTWINVLQTTVQPEFLTEARADE